MTSAAKIFNGITVEFTRDKSTERAEKSYAVKYGSNGFAYVDMQTVEGHFHATSGNAKTGRVGCYNLPIEYTCMHDCECYKDRNCYACRGCYCFHDNQAQYAENLKFYREVDDFTFVTYVSWYIMTENLSLFRYFTCGDIPDMRFVRLICEIARKNPHVRFWLYTKKYRLVNRFVRENGLATIPENMVIIYSHWLNRDGTYYPMENPYNFPTSEFIPIGREEETARVTHVCPCSDPDTIENCATCKTPCYNLQHGQSMALLEHSTPKTKKRDSMLHKAKKALAQALKKARKAV